MLKNPLVLEVKNIKILPATEQSGAAELVAELVLKNQGKKTILINFYYKPWIKAIEPKSSFKIKRAIPPPVRMRKPSDSDIIKIAPNKTFTYKHRVWLENIHVGKPLKEGYTYNFLKSGKYTITFCFESFEEKQKNQKNETFWEGEISSSAEFVYEKHRA